MATARQRTTQQDWIRIAAWGLSGFLIGLLVFFAEPVGHAIGRLVGADIGQNFSGAELDFAHRDQTVVWLFLLCAQTALWAGLALPLLGTLRSFRNWRDGRAEFIGVLALLSLFGLLILLGQLNSVIDYPLPHHQAKLTIFTALAGVATLAIALAMWRVKRAADAALAEPGLPDGAIDRYVDLRRTLNRLLFFGGSMLSAAVLATGALRNAVITWAQAQNPKLSANEVFPSERVLYYGLLLSVFLALIYAVPYQRVRALGSGLRDRALPVLWPPQAGWRGRSEDRTALGMLLRIDEPVWASFRGGVAILAPLVSALLTRALASG